MIEVKVPDIGDFTGVPVIEVLVKPGDTVAAEDALITLESDKATMEVPAPQAGTVKRVAVKEGDNVSQGDLVLTLEVRAAEAPTPAEPKSDGPKSNQAEPSTPEPSESKPAAPAKEAAATASETTIEVKVPDIGDFTGVPVIEVLVKPGDTVAAEDALITLESDKATMEVPAPQAGTVKRVAVKEGDSVSQGDLVVTLQVGTVRPAQPVPEPEPEAPAPQPVAALPPLPDRGLEAMPDAPVPPPEVAERGSTPHASPSVRKYARELGANLHRMAGSGPKGRILREDVQRFVKTALRQPATSGAAAGSGIPPIPAVDFAQFGDVETVPLKRIRKLSAVHLQRSWLNLPHVTQTDNADITDLEVFRKAENTKGSAKLTLLPFILKAVACAIDAYPEFAASLTPDGQNLVMKGYRHIGFAADTENGLVVPVVRDVNRKGIIQLAKETAALAEKARAGKLAREDMQGGVFSVSSLGGIGGSHFTPIINAPEVAILGVSRAIMQPVWNGTEFAPRLMLPLSLSYDHRVIDGAYAARFIVFLGEALGDLRKLIL